MIPCRRLAALWLGACMFTAPALAAPATGFRPVVDRGVWWFQAPGGARFLAKGVNCLGPGPSASLYDPARPEYSTFVHVKDTYEAWAARTRSRLLDWGFNTIGGWSDPRTYRWANLFAHPFTNYQVEFGSIW